MEKLRKGTSIHKEYVLFGLLAPCIGYVIFCLLKGYPIFDIYHVIVFPMAYAKSLTPSILAAFFYYLLNSSLARFEIKISNTTSFLSGAMAGLASAIFCYPWIPQIDRFINNIGLTKYFILFVLTASVTACLTKIVATDSK